MRYNSDALTCYFFRYQLRKESIRCHGKILIAEDEEPIANLIRMNLKKRWLSANALMMDRKRLDRMEEATL